MQNYKHNQLFSFFILSAAIIFVLFIMRPLLVPLIVAAMFAFLFQPLYRKFRYWTKERVSLSAFIVVVLSVIMIVIPVGLLGTMIVKEATGLYKDLAEGNSGVVIQIENFFANTKSSFPLLDNVDLSLSKYASQGLEALAKNVGAIFSSFAKIILNLFVFLIAFYYLLKDGDKFSKYLIELSPLDDDDDQYIIKRLKSAVQAIVKGNLSIGLIQGALTGIGFAIFGVPNPVLWGSITAIAALIPGIGTTLVIAPAVIYLFVSGQTFSAIGLSIWGLTAVGLIDNLLGPRLVGKGMQLHPLAVFVSVLGGMVLFGPLGFIFGPLVFGICLALIDIYFSLKKHNRLGN